ncbi:unnamed protein product, partial [Adineta ricciae]
MTTNTVSTTVTTATTSTTVTTATTSTTVTTATTSTTVTTATTSTTVTTTTTSTTVTTTTTSTTVTTATTAALPTDLYFSFLSFTTGTSPRSLAVMDINDDNQSDIITANYGSNTVSVLRNTGNNAFTSQVIFPVGTNPQSVAF